MVLFCKSIIQINANFLMHTFVMIQIGILMGNRRAAMQKCARVVHLAHALKISQYFMINQILSNFF